MPFDAGSVHGRIVLDTSGATRAVGQFQGAFGGMMRQVATAAAGFAAVTAGLAGMVAGLGGMVALINRGIGSIDRINMRAAQMAANLGNAFPQAAFDNLLKASRQLLELIEKMDAAYSGTGEELQTLADAMVRYGLAGEVVKLITDETGKAKGEFIALAEIIKSQTGGLNFQYQVMQEIRALMSGEARMGASLAMMIQARGINLKEQLPIWEREGTVVENIVKLFPKMVDASKEISTTLSAQRASWQTIVDRLLRAGLLPAYEDMVTLQEHVNKLLFDQEGRLTNIGRILVFTIGAAWETMKATIRAVVGETKSLESSLQNVFKWAFEIGAAMTSTVFALKAIGAAVQSIFYLLRAVVRLRPFGDPLGGLADLQKGIDLLKSIPRLMQKNKEALADLYEGLEASQMRAQRGIAPPGPFDITSLGALGEKVSPLGGTKAAMEKATREWDKAQAEHQGRARQALQDYRDFVAGMIEATKPLDEVRQALTFVYREADRLAKKGLITDKERVDFRRQVEKQAHEYAIGLIEDRKRKEIELGTTLRKVGDEWTQTVVNSYEAQRRVIDREMGATLAFLDAMLVLFPEHADRINAAIAQVRDTWSVQIVKTMIDQKEAGKTAIAEVVAARKAAAQALFDIQKKADEDYDKDAADAKAKMEQRHRDAVEAARDALSASEFYAQRMKFWGASERQMLLQLKEGLEVAIARMVKLGESTEAFQERLIGVKDQLARMAFSLKNIFLSIQDDLKSAVSNWLYDMMAGVKSLKDALLDLWQNILQAIARELTQRMATDIVDWLYSKMPSKVPKETPTVPKETPTAPGQSIVEGNLPGAPSPYQVNEWFNILGRFFTILQLLMGQLRLPGGGGGWGQLAASMLGSIPSGGGGGADLQALQGMSKGPGMAVAGGPPITINFNVSAVDSAGVADFFSRHSRQLGMGVLKAVRENSPARGRRGGS